jgi:hypothetical protein
VSTLPVSGYGSKLFGPETDNRCRPHLKPTNKSYGVDETYIEVKGRDRYLYQATVRNGLLQVYPPLNSDIRCDALIIGGGISGALLAHRLTKRGVECVLIDRRDVGHGSTSASTALLHYEIDTPLHQLRLQVGNYAGERAYSLGIEAIQQLQKLAGKECGFALRPSLQVATRTRDVGGLKKEYLARRKLNFAVTMLDRWDLRQCGVAS